MPFYQKINICNDSFVFIWHSTESEHTLASTLTLSKKSLELLKNKKNTAHRKSFLSVRHLLKIADLSDFDLIYDEEGKPHLSNNQHISISHSFDFSCIIVSNQPVGIDIEREREKILTIKHKFLHPFEIEHFDTLDLAILHIIWGVKEVVYKLKSPLKPIFKTDICIKNIDLQSQQGEVLVFDTEIFTFHFKKIEKYWLVYIEVV